ncbi:MAG: hypothetical protein V2J24_21855 [Pseudomonadales bacterium]|jgi:acyl-CoA thioester hydrolase|nr:hypothetical protein [Pseudomonadales bacterium]
MTKPDAGNGLRTEPLWRGSVRRWECDENDHLNVRFHFVAVGEALEFLFRSRWARPAPRVIRQHARFVAEALLATPLLARGVVLEASEASVGVWVELVDAVSGTVHSTMLSELDVTAAELGLDPEGLPGAARLPAHGARRGLSTPMRHRDFPSLADSESLPMVEIGRGVFGAAECTEGMVNAPSCVGRIADGVLNLITHLHGDGAVESRQSGRIGGAVVEYELVYPRPVAAGTPFVARSGIAGLDGRIQRFCHWLFDAGSGEMLCASNAIAVALDLETRRAAQFSAEQRAAIEAHCTPELAL